MGLLPQRSEFDRRFGASLGYRGQVTGSGDISSADNTVPLEATTQGASLTRKFWIPVTGLKEIEVFLRPSAIAATVTVTLYKVLRDDTTKAAGAENTSSPTPALAANVVSQLILKDLRSCAYVVLEVVTAAASSVTWDRAEFQGGSA